MTDPFTHELASFGDRLSEATSRAERRRRRGARAGGAAAAACVIALGALVAIPGAGRLDPVAEARAALGRGGDLLHYRVSFVAGYPAVNGRTRTLPAPEPEEVWSTAGEPRRWRVRRPATNGCTIISTGDHAYVNPTESVYDDGVLRDYSPWSRVVIQQAIGPDHQFASPVGGLFQHQLGADDADPTTTLRRALDRGILRVTAKDDRAGTRTLSGAVGTRRTVPDTSYSLDIKTGERTPMNPGKTIEQRPVELSYTVDAESFAPRELKTSRYTLWSRAGGRPHYKWVTSTVRFHTFERLDSTQANRRLLSLSAPKGTRVVRAAVPTAGLDAPGIPPRIDVKAMRAAEPDAKRCRAATR